VPEARLEDSGSGLAPANDGWFVVNVRDAEWWTSKTFGSGVSELAARYGASAEEETPDPKQAYARFERPERERPSYWDRLPWA
jgi:hypothetical protein